MSLTHLLERAAHLLTDVGDIVTGRVSGPEPPAWCRARGWDGFLLSLSDADLERGEELGLIDALADLTGAPQDLRALARSIKDVILTVTPAPALVSPTQRRGVPGRKLGQVLALAELCGDRLDQARRVVDVGAGRGYLTRALADRLRIGSLGLERDPERVAQARALTADDEQVEFEAFDATPERLAFRPGDLAVGLHACGQLGDTLVSAAARDGVDLVLVCCCLQNVSGHERRPLSKLGARLDLTLGRDVLGLANQASRRRVGTTAEVMSARETRYGLRLLLRARGLEVRTGAEMRGIQVRKARRGLARLSELALRRRGLAAATEAELREVSARARAEFARVRRLSLARGMLGRLLETALVLDRACALEEAGHQVSVREVFSFSLSPRNLGIVARAR